MLFRSLLGCRGIDEITPECLLEADIPIVPPRAKRSFPLFPYQSQALSS